MSERERFRLESVLDQRKFFEEKAQLAFTEACGRAQLARGELDRLLEKKSRCQEALGRAQTRCDRIGDIVGQFRYIERLDREIVLRRKGLEGLEAACEERRKELLEALKNRKVIEKLKEKQVADRLRKERILDRKQLDELAVTRFAGGRTPANAHDAARAQESLGKNCLDRNRLPQDGADRTLDPAS